MIIGIGGCSRAGKSTLANNIKEHYSKCEVICQDDFVKDINLIPKIKDHIDWEHPQSIDYPAFEKAIHQADARNNIVIVEGILAFYYEPVNQLFDKRIFIKIDKESFEFFKKSDDRWGIEPDWYIEHIWQSYQKFGIPELDGTYLTISSEADFSMKSIIEYIEK